MDLSIYTPYLQQVGVSLLAGLAYTAVGWFNYWIQKRQENSTAEWDWKKMGATLTASVFVGLVIGIINAVSGQELTAVYSIFASIGGISIAQKIAVILWYGKDAVVDISRRITGKKR